MVRKSSSATLKPMGKTGSNKNIKGGKENEAGMDKEGQKRTLNVIMNALRTNERKKNREEVAKIVRK